MQLTISFARLLGQVDTRIKLYSVSTFSAGIFSNVRISCTSLNFFTVTGIPIKKTNPLIESMNEFVLEKLSFYNVPITTLSSNYLVPSSRYSQAGFAPSIWFDQNGQGRAWTVQCPIFCHSLHTRQELRFLYFSASLLAQDFDRTLLKAPHRQQSA